MNKDIYKFGNCKICNKYTQLKNELCINCNDNELPDFLKDIFGGFKDEENRNF